MSENLEKRKSDLLVDLENRYAGKRGRWWPENLFAYTMTADLAEECKKIDNEVVEVIIRPKLAILLSVSAFFLTGILIQVLPIPGFPKANFGPIFLTIFVIGFVYFVARGISRKPRIIVNTNGLWTDKLNELILWKNIVATFIHRTGDGDFCYLLVHYYIPETNQFQETEYRIDELDIKNNELAFYIEKFKRQASNS